MIKLTRKRVSFNIPSNYVNTFQQLIIATKRTFGNIPYPQKQLSYIQDNKDVYIFDTPTLQIAKRNNNLQIFIQNKDSKTKSNNSEKLSSQLGNVNQFIVQNKDKHWNQRQWNEQIKINLPCVIQESIRKELKMNVRSNKTHQKVYQSTQLNHNFLSSIEAYNKSTERLGHSEDGIGSFIMSFYCLQFQNRKIPQQQMPNSIWKLDKWRHQNKSSKYEQVITGLQIKHKAETTIPYLYAPSNELITKLNSIPPQQKTNFLFPSQSSTNNTPSPDTLTQQGQYFIFDKLYTQISLLSKNQTSPADAKESLMEIRNFSDDDLNFATNLIEAFAQYRSNGTQYSTPVNNLSGMLPDFDDDQVVGILGDWGTGERDAQDLIDELVYMQRATVILHLGDVYYGGFPNQYQKISEKINSLQRLNPKLRYYTIPGNHDYYTFGGPLIEHLNNNHLDKRLNQQFTFFCLRNRSKTVQFVGLNTGLHDDILINSYDPFWEGTYIQKDEVQWAIQKIRQFPGKTILLTHHQPFSAFQCLIGGQTESGFYNPHVNPLLFQSLFEVIPLITCWFWGHQHRICSYNKYSFGINQSILLGNSGFQNNNQDYYKVIYPCQGIVDLKLTPQKDVNGYYNHTGAILTNFMSQQIHIKYVYMTSSYDNPATKTNQIMDVITNISIQPVKLNTPYQILQQHGFSLNASNQVIELCTQPTSIEFHLVDNPTQAGIVPTNTNLLINICRSSMYMHYSTLGFAELGQYLKEDTTQQFKYYWQIKSNDQFLQKGRIFNLLNVQKQKMIGRQGLMRKYVLSSKETPSRFFIYERDGKITNQKRANNSILGSFVKCCNVM